MKDLENQGPVLMLKIMSFCTGSIRKSQTAQSAICMRVQKMPENLKHKNWAFPSIPEMVILRMDRDQIFFVSKIHFYVYGSLLREILFCLLNIFRWTFDIFTIFTFLIKIMFCLFCGDETYILRPDGGFVRCILDLQEIFDDALRFM